MADVIDILKERCLLEDVTGPGVEKILESSRTVYAGFDPTSSSLAIGNFVPIMAMAHFQRCGHKVIAVVGGATGMIGDPSGRTEERVFLSEAEIECNTIGIKRDLGKFLDFDHPTAPAEIVNNNDWMRDITFVEFLRDIGKHFRLGSMLGKESVRSRLNSEAGMSFTEFSYQLLQAYDFLRLYDTRGCELQVGGSDQWGNITAGVDLVRKLRGAEVYGLTFPLVCDSTGQKFGKSEGNAVYLDSNVTSYYDFYQFFVRVMDSDVIRFLKIFTFLPLTEISKLEQEVKNAPENRVAQKKLAEEVTRIVHGEHGLQVALRASAVLFGESMDGLNAGDLMEIFANVDSTELTRHEVDGVPVVDIVAATGLCDSKGAARRLIENKGLYINNRRVESIDAKVSSSDIIDGVVLVLRSGKKNFHLVKITAQPVA